MKSELKSSWNRLRRNETIFSEPGKHQRKRCQSENERNDLKTADEQRMPIRIIDGLRIDEAEQHSNLRRATNAEENPVKDGGEPQTRNKAPVGLPFPKQGGAAIGTGQHASRETPCDEPPPFFEAETMITKRATAIHG